VTAIAKVLSRAQADQGENLANRRHILRRRAGRVSAFTVKWPGFERRIFLTAS